MTRWRKRIGPEGMEEVLKATVETALRAGAAKPSSLERVSVVRWPQEYGQVGKL